MYALVFYELAFDIGNPFVAFSVFPFLQAAAYAVGRFYFGVLSESDELWVMVLAVPFAGMWTLTGYVHHRADRLLVIDRSSAHGLSPESILHRYVGMGLFYAVAAVGIALNAFVYQYGLERAPWNLMPCAVILVAFSIVQGAIVYALHASGGFRYNENVKRGIVTNMLFGFIPMLLVVTRSFPARWNAWYAVGYDFALAAAALVLAFLYNAFDHWYKHHEDRSHKFI